MDAVITTEDLRKSFRGRKGTVEAVKGVSFEVGRGEIFGFLGPNGAGKTTTLRMLTTLLPIDSGSANVAGSDVAREPKQVRQRIGYVSQAGGADDPSTGWENLILQGRLYGGDLDSVRQRAKELEMCIRDSHTKDAIVEKTPIATGNSRLGGSEYLSQAAEGRTGVDIKRVNDSLI